MNREEFDALDARIRARAESLWKDAGHPEGGPDRYLDHARELVAMSEVSVGALDPNAPDVVEEASLQRNLGEFATLVDQGEEQTFPDVQKDDEGIRASDGDAADSGGVLPEDGAADRVRPR